MHSHGRLVLSVVVFALAVAQSGIAVAQESLALTQEALAAMPAEQAEAVGQLINRPDGLRCPISNLFRTPEQVIAARIAAINAGDLDAVMCTYAPDAKVIMPSGVLSGLSNIRAAFEQMSAMLGNTAPALTSMNVAGEVVMTTFSFEGPIFSIPDGSDTYVIRWGYIHYQTVHNTLVFNQPPAN